MSEACIKDGVWFFMKGEVEKGDDKNVAFVCFLLLFFVFISVFTKD